MRASQKFSQRETRKNQETMFYHRTPSLLSSIIAFFNPLSRIMLDHELAEAKRDHQENLTVIEESRHLGSKVDDLLLSAKTLSK